MSKSKENVLYYPCNPYVQNLQCNKLFTKIPYSNLEAKSINNGIIFIFVNKFIKSVSHLNSQD